MHAAPESAPDALLLVNLGTPDAATPRAVRRYLREFLSDPYVLDMHPALRSLLLYGVILPFRPRRSAEAYRQIWTPEGSPLLLHGLALRDGLRRTLGDPVRVALAMRYGRPSIAAGLAELLESGPRPRRLLVVPLFPQYSLAATQSALDAARRAHARIPNAPPLDAIECFYDAPGFVDAVASLARPRIEAVRPQHVLFSYHGLPERQVRRTDPSGSHCLAQPDCCEHPGGALARCYRAQSLATTRAVAGRLGLPADTWSTAFQSRLGRVPWIQPYTDRALEELAGRGVERLVVVCPSFVADCLETLEEIGIRGREQWRALGGSELELVPCVNAEPAWVEGLAGMVRARLQSASSERATRAPHASVSETETPSR